MGELLMAKDNTIWIILGAIILILVVTYGPGLFQKQAILYDCNVCSSNSAVIANEQVSCEAAGWTCSVSGTCLSCSQGGYSCTDTDGGKLPNTGGKAYGNHAGTSFSYYDYCVDSSTVYEYSCTGTSLNLEGIVCASGRTCVDGANGDYCKPVSCTPNWQCSAWGTCTAGTQYRTCDDLNNCGITTNEPAVSQSCTVSCSGTAPDCTTLDGCAGKTSCINGGWTGACVKTDSNCGSATKCSDTTDSGGVAYFNMGEKRVCFIDSCSGFKTCGSGGIWGICIKIDTSCGNSVNGSRCPYTFTGMEGGGLKVENLADQSNPRCIPTNCSYVETSGLGLDLGGILTQLPNKLVSTCCAGSVKKVTGGYNIVFYGITLDRRETGICTEESGFCTWFGFLKDALPPEMDSYSCMIGIGAIGIVFLIILKGFAR